MDGYFTWDGATSDFEPKTGKYTPISSAMGIDEVKKVRLVVEKLMVDEKTNAPFIFHTKEGKEIPYIKAMLRATDGAIQERFYCNIYNYLMPAFAACVGVQMPEKRIKLEHLKMFSEHPNNVGEVEVTRKNFDWSGQCKTTLKVKKWIPKAPRVPDPLEEIPF